MERKYIELDLKGFQLEKNSLIGYASTFGFPMDFQGDVIQKGAFAATTKNFKPIPLLDAHKQDSANVLGTVVEAIEDDHGLLIKAKLADTPLVNEIKAKLKQGHISKFSVGMLIVEADFATKDGIDYRVIKNVELLEVSVVPIPANPRAEILAVKNHEPDEPACENPESNQSEGEAEITEGTPEDERSDQNEILQLYADSMQGILRLLEAAYRRNQ